MLLLAVLLVFGLWPYHQVLGWLPWGADATKWVFRGSLDADWWTWAAGSKHFVGYRPVTALSFTLNHAVTGYAAWGFRATDLALHLATGGLTFAAYRALTGDRGVLGLVPVLVVLLHPASEEIVPHVARRSYLLASTFGLGALLCWLRALRPERPAAGWVLAATALVLLAILSNELAYVMPPLLVLLALLRGHRAKDVALAMLPLAVVVAAAVAARYQVLGTLGGYSKRYFAYLRGGHPMWRELTGWEPVRIAEAAWRYTLAPNGVVGGAPLFGGVAGTVAAVVSSAWLVWVALVAPVRRWSEPEQRVRWVLAAWLLGAAVIIVGSQTWFWRQAHGLLPPLGMLVALGLGDAWAAVRAGRRVAALGGVVGIALLASVFYNAPFPSLHVRDHAATRSGTPVVRTVSRLAGTIRGPATVYLVVPLRGPGAYMTRQWVSRHVWGTGVDVTVLGHLQNTGRQSRARLTLDREAQRLTLDHGLTFVDRGGRGAVRAKQRSVDLARLGRKGRPVYVVAVDADDAWMVRVPDPPEEAPAAEPEPEPPPEDTGHSE